MLYYKNKYDLLIFDESANLIFPEKALTYGIYDQTSTCSKMADKTPTSLTSHSLFPSGGDGFDLDQLSGPFSFAPALVPTSSSPVVQPSSANANVEIDLNPGVYSKVHLLGNQILNFGYKTSPII